ncbi:carcinoembryonic antigen-related cell adhesion molecule 1-like [Centropristis striata]|uniref:carcinoembryonic antigen-related cell adhesion molecule 1-like n=1 Tax=Centropristis striata TaxID=184440 RepID=UPI0027DFA3DB|nr:carcinoembryonic antigen-related cell adhesion molecule 1-like [Centropristis striata]
MDLFAFKTLLLLLSFIGRGDGNILPDGPVDASLGKDVTLKTMFDKAEYIIILWNYSDGTDQVNVATVSAGGVKVAAPYEGRVTVNTTNGYLTITGLKSEDSGDYSISLVTPESITKTGETKLRVLEPVSDVKIKSSLPEALEHNSTVDLTCSAKGSFLKFTWLRGATPITIDGKRLSVKEEELSSMLTVRDVLRSDFAAPIFCTVSNKLDTEKSAAFNLTVFYGPEKIKITPDKTAKFLRAKSNFNLTCSAISNPAATFNWYHGALPLEVAGPVLTLEMIEKLKLGKQAEDYTCRATNAKTLRTIASPAVSFAVMEAISGAKVTGPGSAGPPVTLIAGNSTANLSCKATAGTVKTTVWLKDGKPLTTSSRTLVSADKSSVTINPLQKDDNGVYECQLSNPVNTEKASYKMVVNYGPEPVVLEGDKAVEMNDHVTLTCSAASMPPANFTWKFNGTLMADVKTSQYKIEMARFKNSGTYMCEAFNPVTGKRTSSTHVLAVKEEGELDGLSDGAIAGIVIAVLVALGAAIGLIMYCRQKVPVESPY